MKRRSLMAGTVIILLLSVGLAACAAPGGQAAATSQAGQATSAAQQPRPGGTAAATSAAQATSQAATSAAANGIAQQSQLELGISGIGEVTASRDANLVFAVNGTVKDVLVEEGQTVTATQVLARLDLRRFDQAIRQAEAGLASAQAQQTGLTQAPRSAAVQQAQAQVRQAEIGVAQARTEVPQDVRTAEAALTAAQSTLQSTRDQLSRAKTQAEAGAETSAQSLVQAQAAYAQAKSDWDFVNQTNQNPNNPEIVNPTTGKSSKNKVEDTVREQYYAAFVQAEAALHKAEQAVQQANIDAEEARKAETVGIQGGEQQVTQAQASLDKVRVPNNQNRVAAAQTQLDQARAGLALLNPDPTDADKIQADASVTQAEVSLEQAQLDREDAELRAPFDGVISVVNVDPGDPSSAGSQPAMTIVDVSHLRVDVDISDIDVGRITVGQPAKAFIDAVPGNAYSGKVSYIAPAATAQGNIRTYVVRVALDNQQGLRPGMSARIEIQPQK